MNMKAIVRALTLVGLGFAMSACNAEPKRQSLNVVGYNHTDENINEFIVGSAAGGGFTEAHTGGGSFNCCASVPKQWHDGMSLDVKWSRDLKNYKQRTVVIPRYSGNDAFLAVHFLRNGEVKVYVTHYLLGHPDYPLSGPDAGLRAGENPVREDLLRAPDAVL